MRAIAVDDERLALESMRMKLTHIERISQVHAFISPEAALEHFAENGAEIAFLDIQMPRIDGLTLATRMRELKPGVIIIFITGYSEYALDAHKLHADGYLMKPMSEEDINRELDDVERRRMPLEAPKRIRVQCFGNFEVFTNETPLRFSRSKSKEMFAYLILKKGAACTIRELAAVLFEDKPYDKSQVNYLQSIARAMVDAFAGAGAEDVIIKSWNSYAVNTEAVDCDYYRFCALEPAALGAYTGEYMFQYSWAEFTAAYLDSRLP